MKATTEAFLGVGSNRGDRLAHLRFAYSKLQEEPAVRVRAASPVYASEAHTRTPGEEAPSFLNGVVRIWTMLAPHALLACCLRIEEDSGRQRQEGRRWKPRMLDLDLLLFGGRTIWAPDLRVPHPRMGTRRFVLQPLADLAPNRYVPAPYDATVAELLDTCGDRAELSRTALSFCACNAL